MSELEAQGYIDDMIRMFRLMKRTSADADLMNKYIAALDVAYAKLSLQCQKSKDCQDKQFPRQVDIEDYIKEIGG